MRVGPFDFRPGLWPSIVTLLLLPGMIWLGIWQLDRAAWKQGLVDAHHASGRLAPVNLEWMLDGGDITEYRPVVARGHYDLGQQLLLDNKTYRGHAGYHVLTPLRLKDHKSVVLVNRGWVPMGQSRAVLPDLPGPAEKVVVEAIVKRPPDRLFRLDSAEEAHAGWPQVVQQLELEPLEQRLGYRLLPVILLLDKADGHGFVRDWKPAYDVPPDKHRAYAMQWFTLALVLLLIYIGVNTRRITNKSLREDNEAE
jgi:surfeit locus 1 family protein